MIEKKKYEKPLSLVYSLDVQNLLSVSPGAEIKDRELDEDNSGSDDWSDPISGSSYRYSTSNY